MLFFLRFSTSEMLAMLPSQRSWITWSMVVLGETGSVYDKQPISLRAGEHEDFSVDCRYTVQRDEKKTKEHCFSFAPVSPARGELQAKAGRSLVPKLAFPEPRLKFSPARHPSASTPCPPLSSALLSYHHGSDTPPLKTHV